MGIMRLARIIVCPTMTGKCRRTQPKHERIGRMGAGGRHGQRRRDCGILLGNGSDAGKRGGKGRGQANRSQTLIGVG